MAISGSPRKGGNTELLIKSSLEPFREQGWDIREFFLSEKIVRPCIGCESCRFTGSCIIDNDDMAFLYQELPTCDAIIIGSPVYYSNVTSQLKAVFDRSFALGYLMSLDGKIGGAIAVGRTEGGGQSFVLSVIHNYYLSSGAICVPCEINGLSAMADKHGSILAQPNRLKQARALGENIIKYAAMMKNT